MTLLIFNIEHSQSNIWRQVTFFVDILGSITLVDISQSLNFPLHQTCWACLDLNSILILFFDQVPNISYFFPLFLLVCLRYVLWISNICLNSSLIFYFIKNTVSIEFKSTGFILIHWILICNFLLESCSVFQYYWTTFSIYIFSLLVRSISHLSFFPFCCIIVTEFINPM
jgi:hypothetical protein